MNNESHPVPIRHQASPRVDPRGDRREECSLPGCTFQCYRDPTTGWSEDYCGRTHATRGKENKILPRRGALDRQHVEVVFGGRHGDTDGCSVALLRNSHPKYASVKRQFLDGWKQGEYDKPTVVRIYQVRNPRDVYGGYCGYRQAVEAAQHFAGRPATKNNNNAAAAAASSSSSFGGGGGGGGSMAAGNEQRRFHGTSMAPSCNFGVKQSDPPCHRPDCAVCSILCEAFRVKHAGTGPNSGAVSQSVTHPSPRQFVH